MNRAMRFSSAAMGMVLLAGLAYYQGNVDHTLGDEDALVGTALTEPADIDVMKKNAIDDVQDNDCKSMADPDHQGADACAEEERSSGTD